MTTVKIFLNGNFVEKDKVTISALDAGLLYGFGLFETLRSYQGKPFLLDRHLERLFSSAQTLGLRSAFSEQEIEKATLQLLKINALSDAYIKIVLSKKEETSPNICSEEPSDSDLLIIVRELQAYPPDLYGQGMKTVVVDIRQNEGSPIPHFKSLNFLNNILAREEARQKGALEGIMLNNQGLVAEGTMSNIFMIKRETIATPSLETGLLPGITRAVVMELAQDIGHPVQERKIFLSELLEAEECFLTNSLMEIMPVSSVGGIKIGTEVPGSVTRALMEEYQKLVYRESASQDP
ncbi:aminotransferase class IV [Candidatus Hakubella thermalkaliphila]|uniref:Branched-chain amino acid aminotransferase n=2 Tax=Candidatus Hakubella thermalkaliphila TaxID=2754717 RepID=A0A6V8P6J6_9ACTN|nr:aminotransferase class IV [Candidatus Hakubella thermalkaliphila]GFP27967.1 branched-chain amino acid aminotransferase [Candidatus Hakubella thermalkaliphila]